MTVDTTVPAPAAALVVLDDGNFSVQSAQLADYLQLPIVSDSGELPAYVLCYGAEGLALKQTAAKADGPVRVDFVSGTSAHRRIKGGGELIVKAVAGSKTRRPSVLDATAGLGRDAFVLANWGYPVTALERSPVVFSLLQDGLNRARAHGDLALQAVVGRIELLHEEAGAYLSSVASAPDVVVIDPMFPPSKKSALVKKDMRAFHYLVGPDHDSSQLLQAAYRVAVHRVVVKRPKKADYLAGEKPNLSIEGKAIRFDIYTKKAYGKA